MTTKKLTKSTASTAQTIAKLFAVGTLATGAVAAVSAAPASAATFNGGQLAFSDGTSDFFTQLNATAVGGNFSVNFNPGGIAFVSSNTLTVPSGANTSPAVSTATSNPAITPSTAIFTRTGANTFSSNAFSFAFGSGTTVNFAAGNIFNLTTNTANTVALDTTNAIGTLVNGADSVAARTLGLSFEDGVTTGGGKYNVIASPVPEPFTVIGTMIGGAAALRMRKKLKAQNKL